MQTGYHTARSHTKDRLTNTKEGGGETERSQKTRDKNQIMRGWKLAVDSETNEEDHQRRVKQPEQRRHKEETRRLSCDKNKKP